MSLRTLGASKRCFSFKRIINVLCSRWQLRVHELGSEALQRNKKCQRPVRTLNEESRRQCLKIFAKSPGNSLWQAK